MRDESASSEPKGPTPSSCRTRQRLPAPSSVACSVSATQPDAHIDSPSNGATFTFGDPISFSGSASDPQEGDLSAFLAWSSDLDGPIGSGSSFSFVLLSIGSHTIDASVDDLDGNTGSDSVGITVVGVGSGFTLTASGFKKKGVQHADLRWNGATSASVDIFRDGVLILTTDNDGQQTDNIGVKGRGVSYLYKVCDAGTGVCSNEAVVSF